MSAPIPELREELVTQFEDGLRRYFPSFGAPVTAHRNDILSYAAIDEVSWDGGTIRLALEFVDRNRIYVLVSWLPFGSTLSTRIESFRVEKNRDILRKGCWCEHRDLPCFDDIDDDFWIPEKPSALRYVSALLENPKARKRLALVFDDDELLAKVMSGGANQKEVLRAADEFLELEENPWNDVRRFSRLTRDDLDHALNGKMELLMARLASEGLVQFCEYVGIRRK